MSAAAAVFTAGSAPSAPVSSPAPAPPATQFVQLRWTTPKSPSASSPRLPAVKRNQLGARGDVADSQNDLSTGGIVSDISLSEDLVALVSAKKAAKKQRKNDEAMEVAEILSRCHRADSVIFVRMKTLAPLKTYVDLADGDNEQGEFKEEDDEESGEIMEVEEVEKKVEEGKEGEEEEVSKDDDGGGGLWRSSMKPHLLNSRRSR